MTRYNQKDILGLLTMMYTSMAQADPKILTEVQNLLNTYMDIIIPGCTSNMKQLQIEKMERQAKLLANVQKKLNKYQQTNMNLQKYLGVEGKD